MDQAKKSKRRAPIADATATVTAKPTVAPVAVAVAVAAPAADRGKEWVNRRASAQATRAANARQTSGRRRFVDPTTCEREYSRAEIEFMHAMHDYKKSSGRMFPTWSEVLEVIKALGYEKPEAAVAVTAHSG
jgi:hypothetical protein